MSALATLTFGNMKDQVAEETGNETSSAKARIGRIINTLYLAICGKREWKWLYDTGSFNTQAIVQEYHGATIIPSSVAKIIQMYYDSNGIRTFMDEMSLREFDRLSQPGSSGNPYAYVKCGLDSNGLWIIKLVYVPKSVITIYYRFKKVINALSLDADVPLIPLVHRPVLMNYAAMKVYKKQGDDANFTTSQQLYLDGLLSLYGDTSVNRRKGLILHNSIMGEEATKHPEGFGTLGDYWKEE